MKKYLVIIFCFCACVEPYEFSNLDQDNLYVVDGFITDQEQIHYIRISKTNNFSNERNQGVEDANVSLLVDGIQNISFYDVGDGYYRTNPIKAEPAHDYQLIILTPDGQQIVSEKMTLHQEQGDIDSISFDPEIVAVLNNEGQEEEKRMVSFDLHLNLKNSSAFYKWNVYPSWIVKADEAIDPLVETCYVEGFRPTDISLFFNKQNSSEEENVVIPLIDIEFSNNMMYDYRIAIEQLSISEDAYIYWDQVRQQQQLQGGIFDPIAGSIKSNLSHEDSNTKVLGFFGVYAKKEYILHFNESQLPYISYPIDCSEKPLLGVPPDCLNCLFNFGKNVTNIKPDNW